MSFLKELAKSTVAAIARNKLSWALMNATLMKIVDYSRYIRREPPPLHPRIEQAIQDTFADMTVRHGPFKGLKYPFARSICSTLIPKFLGSYEAEVHPALEAFCQSAYSDIIDVGCAEGYYAIGLAMRVPSSTVHAYDINTDALALCGEMATHNGVAERVKLGTLFTAADFESFAADDCRALIVCDCEGYEASLLTEEVLPLLANHDFLIELHDGVDPYISINFRKWFADSHHIEYFPALNDLERLQQYDYPELESYDLRDRLLFVREGRTNCFGWMALKSKKHW